MSYYAVESQYKIAFDRESGDYFVYDTSCHNAVLYSGNWTQCLVVYGGLQLGYQLDEIKIRTGTILNRHERSE